MRLVKIKQAYFDRYADEPELLQKSNRPYVLVRRLIFRGRRQMFAIPLRSNIIPNTPKSQYLPLPSSPITKPHYHHGVHYLKMIPVRPEDLETFRSEHNAYYERLQEYIDAHRREIVAGSRRFLAAYEKEGRPPYAADLDRLIDSLRSSS